MTNTDSRRTSDTILKSSTTIQRNTRQRAWIAAVLADTDQLMTSQQIHQRLAQIGRPVGLATVYRTLATMQLAGEIDAVRMGQELAFRRCSPTHHHHLSCRGCGRTFEVTASQLERWADSLAAEHGFTQVEHVIEISGLCPSCR